MTVAPAVRLLVVTDDSLFDEYTAAAVRRSPAMRVRSVSTLSAARESLTEGAVDCVVLDTDLSPERIRIFHRSIRREQPGLPVILAAGRPRAELPAALSYHAFVRKDGPEMGTGVANAARVLTAATVTDDATPAAVE
jgi:DNA-binding NtrC family response regulator